ncbi:MAG: FAD-dependent oxidoreductase [Chloroflexi bacterium]|nr:FAD-dependent oxidoreductase [Chloroflexota bacterium]
MIEEGVERRIAFRWAQPKRTYDVVIVGGGGHGLATAYYLAARHGISDVAVLEARYIGAGNSGRNTTIIRANYGVPEAVRFYGHSVDLYATLEDELECSFIHQAKGLIWLAHTETAMRAERARSLLNLACGIETVMITPQEAKGLCPQLDLSGGGRYPVLGASYHPRASTARHDRVVWGYAAAAMRRGVHVIQGTPVTGLLRDGDRVTGVETASGPIRARVVLSAVGGNVTAVAGQALKFISTADYVQPLATKYGPVYYPLTLTKSVYQKMPEDVVGLGVDNLLTVNANMSEQQVYDILKTFFDNQADVQAIHPEAKKFTLENASRVAPVPFHPGAIKYYTEKGVYKP